MHAVLAEIPQSDRVPRGQKFAAVDGKSPPSAVDGGKLPAGRGVSHQAGNFPDRIRAWDAPHKMSSAKLPVWASSLAGRTEHGEMAPRRHASKPRKASCQEECCHERLATLLKKALVAAVVSFMPMDQGQVAEEGRHPRGEDSYQGSCDLRLP